MKKAIIIIVGILVVIIISAVFILPHLVTLDKFKGRIEDSLEVSLNREVSLGDIGLTLWPGIGAEVKNVRVANLAGFSKGDFVRINSLQVLIQILPLLSGKIEVDRCILTEPRIWVEKNKAGKFNFSDLLEKEKGERPETDEEETPGFIQGLMVSTAAISDGEVHFMDYTKPERTSLSIGDVDLYIKNISIDRPVKVDLSFQWQDVPEKLHVKGSVGPLGRELDITNAPVTISFDAKDIAIEPLGKFVENGVDLAGLLSLRLAVSGKANEALSLDLDGSIRSLSCSERGKILVKEMDVIVKKKATLDLKQEILVVQTGEVSSGDLMLTISGKVSRITSEPDLDVTISARDVPLSGWNTKFPILDSLTGLGGKGDINVSLKGGVSSVIDAKGTIYVRNLTYLDEKSQKMMVDDLSTKINHAVSVNLRESVVDLKDIQLTVWEYPIHVKGRISDLEKPQPDFNLKIAAKGIPLSGWNKKFPAVEPIAGLSGTADIDWSVKGRTDNLYLSGTTSLQRLNYTDTETRKTLVTNLNVEINHPLALDLKREALDVRDLKLQLQGTPITITGVINQFKENPNLNLKVSAQNIPLKTWQQAFSASKEIVYLKGDLTLTANIKGRPDKVMDVSVLLNSGQLEIDRVEQTKTEVQQRKTVETKGKEGSKPESPMGDINLAGKVRIGQGRFEKIIFSNLDADLVKVGSVFELNNMVFNTFKGKVTGKGKVDMEAATPRFSFTAKVDGMEADQVYNSFASPKDLLFGLLTIDFAADGVGFEEEELTKNLSASGRFDLKDGRITSFDLLKEISAIANLLGVETHGKETKFDDLSMNFSIKSGKIFTDNLSLMMKDLKLKASGHIGLDKTIDLPARAWLSPRFKVPGFTQYVFERDENGWMVVPFRLAGSILKPRLTLDTKALRTGVQEGVKKQIEKGIEKIPVEEEIKGIFKDILRGKKK